MKQTTKLALTLLTGFALGGGAIGSGARAGSVSPGGCVLEGGLDVGCSLQRVTDWAAPGRSL